MTPKSAVTPWESRWLTPLLRPAWSRSGTRQGMPPPAVAMIASPLSSTPASTTQVRASVNRANMDFGLDAPKPITRSPSIRGSGFMSARNAGPAWGKSFSASPSSRVSMGA